MPDPRRGCTPLDSAIGLAIRHARIQRGMTQGDLARATGITCQQIHKYEAGLNRMAATRLVDLCRALDLAPGDLLQNAAEHSGASPTGKGRRVLELSRAAATLPEHVQAALAHLARTLQPNRAQG